MENQKKDGQIKICNVEILSEGHAIEFFTGCDMTILMVVLTVREGSTIVPAIDCISPNTGHTTVEAEGTVHVNAGVNRFSLPLRDQLHCGGEGQRVRRGGSEGVEGRVRRVRRGGCGG